MLKFGPASATPAATAPEVIHDELHFGGYLQPPDVPPDPTGEQWRGPPGPPGPPGAAGSDGIDGVDGAPGPSAVSADAGNTATLGSDALIYVPASDGGASITVSDTPPALEQGALWFDSVSTQLFVGYVDPSGPPGQWVIATNSGATGGAYVALSGSTMTGPLTLYGDPTTDLQAAPRRYVDNAINLAGNYLGTWSVAANSPNISGGGSISNANYVATTSNPAVPETVPVGVPGIAGLTVGNGDRVIWASGLGVWQILRSAGVTLAAADARYVALAGSTMTGALVLNGNASAALNPVPLQQLTSTLGSYAPIASPTFTGTVTIPSGASIAGYAPLAAPVFTGDARAVTPTYGDNDTSIATTAFVQSAVSPALQNVGRNFVHNSMFNVQQRGAGAFSANGYTADRWAQYRVLDTGSVSIIALSDANRNALGDQSATSAIQVATTGNAGATALSSINQPIEGVRRLAAQTVTVSFYATASAGTPKLGVSIDQSFGTGGSSSAYVTGTGQSVTLGTTWPRYSVTIAVPSVGGKTLGTNGNDCSYLNFWFSAGANNATASGSVGVQSSTVTIWGIQLEIGTQATPLEKVDPGEDLRRCQRFYQQKSLDWAGQVSSGVGYRTGGTIYPPMRSTPTVTVNTNQSSNFGALSTAVTFGLQPSGQLLQLSATASATGFGALTALLNLSADL